jgi:hypothetical protein
MRKRVLSLVGCGLIVGVVLILWDRSDMTEVRLSDGRLFRIEAVTFGTNHVVGHSDWWLFPLRKILPDRIVQFFTPTRGQSRGSTERPALVVWVHAYDPSTGRYVDCQGVNAAITDERGDVYPANGTGHGSFGDKSNFNRQDYIFNVFPRRSKRLQLRLTPWKSDQSSVVEFANPAGKCVAASWTPEPIPATHQVGELEVALQELRIKTNGTPTRYWEPQTRHWEPVFQLSRVGKPATDWESPEWVAEDATGNRGQTLGLHEPLLKFIVTTRPKPEAVSDLTRRWQLPWTDLQTIGKGVEWNTNHTLGDVSVTIIGLFPPGSYTFSQGQLTNPPSPVMANNGWTGMRMQVGMGRFQDWQTHTTTNYVAYVRRVVRNPEQRIAVGLRDDEGRVWWGQSTTSGEIISFVLAVPPGTRRVALEVTLLEPVQTEFVVKPPVLDRNANTNRQQR